MATDAVRWFTRGLKIPTFVGKLASGEVIKGGPYPAVQAVTFAAVFGVGILTARWWAPWVGAGEWSTLVTPTICAGVAAAASFAVRVVPATAVNPVLIAAGVAAAITRPSVAHHRGRRVAAPRPLAMVPARVTITPAPTSPAATAPRPGPAHRENTVSAAPPAETLASQTPTDALTALLTGACRA